MSEEELELFGEQILEEMQEIMEEDLEELEEELREESKLLKRFGDFDEYFYSRECPECETLRPGSEVDEHGIDCKKCNKYIEIDYI